MSPGSGEEVRVDVEGRTLKLSNLDKVLYPRTGTTKGEVLNYYAQVAPVLLPLLKDRPVTRVRWPNGVEKARFFEKNAPAGTPRWVRTADVPTTGSRGESRHGDRLVFPIIDDLATLTWAANLAALELHVHQWTVAKKEQAPRCRPDRDRPRPGRGGRAPRVLPASRCWCATSWPSATSTPGRSPAAARACTSTRHLPRRRDSEEDPATVAKEIAEQLQAEHPKLVTATMTKAKRSGKVFLDWSQNAGSKTTVSPYSLRGVERPFVATPVTWDEVAEGADDPLGLEQFRYDEVLARVAEHGDLFTD